MQLILDIAIALISIAVVAQGLMAGRTHFVSAKMPLGSVLISAVSVVTLISFLWWTFGIEQPIWALLIGGALELVGFFLFRAAMAASRQAGLRHAFTDEPPQGLLKAGPYRTIRHPFYTAYLAFWIGWTIAVWTPWALINLAILVVIYVLAARMEEEKFAGTPMAAEYAEHKRRTGMFWPGTG
jgi:protein-S-isoprenylcysteine O-methyltransferase Ste14